MNKNYIQVADEIINSLKEEDYSLEINNVKDIKITKFNVFKNDETYLTYDFSIDNFSKEKLYKLIINDLRELVGSEDLKNTLIVGLGNEKISVDRIGSLVCDKIIPISSGTVDKGILKKLNKVKILTPKVAGTTGMESSFICEVVAKKTSPTLIILIDSLLTEDINRVYSSIQISNCSLKVNKKQDRYISKPYKVISIGLSTMISYKDISKTSEDNKQLYLTLKDLDLYNEKISEFLAYILNSFINENLRGVVF